MRKLNIGDYTVQQRIPDNMNPGHMIDIELNYPVKDSIMAVMFRRELQLSGAELVRQNMLAMKLETCKENEILLEDAEYDRIKSAFDKCTGFVRSDVELVRRINEAEVVEIK